MHFNSIYLEIFIPAIITTTTTLDHIEIGMVMVFWNAIWNMCVCRLCVRTMWRLKFKQIKKKKTLAKQQFAHPKLFNTKNSGKSIEIMNHCLDTDLNEVTFPLFLYERMDGMFLSIEMNLNTYSTHLTSPCIGQLILSLFR